MRLNKDDKDAFVRAVMDDVPQVDYQAQFEKIVREDAVAKLPPKIRAIWNDKDLRHHIKTTTIYGPYFNYSRQFGGVAVPGCEYEIKDDAAIKVKEISDASLAQKTTRNELRAKVESVINGCSTLKQALERLPEFAKYLPKDRDGTGVGSLPAVSNVVADLTKAGWPKGEKKK